ncbi:hypothetical protein PENTCL1PPCAC_16441 [Pristionchus entomophagus]|uniref:G protein-coupled receptor n=1 Tax=Pristionchus entomophagus TaxID=358040 RepID=A0AAV5TJ10_9BILA|nr:hypothetical protein PENTCL1PPCAC_16441 [Pristionchus entomophagus]
MHANKSRTNAPSYFADLYHVNVSDPDVGFFHITWKRKDPTSGDMTWHWPTIRAMTVSLLLTMATAAVIAISIVLIARSIESSNLAPKTRKLQQLLFKALLIQTAAPCVFAYVPQSMIICLPLAGFLSHCRMDLPILT